MAKEVEAVFLPWLLDGCVAQAEQVATAHSLCDDLLKAALKRAAEVQAAAAAKKAAEEEAAAAAADFQRLIAKLSSAQGALSREPHGPQVISPSGPFFFFIAMLCDVLPFSFFL